jgi:hypothetical protein
MKRCSARVAGMAICVAAAVAGCAAPKGGAGSAGRADDPCNPIVGAVVGGAVGALIGGDRRRTQGTLVGAGLGALACIGYNYNARQTKSAEQVGAEYRQRNNALPPVPTVTAYRTESSPAQARGGDDITVTSNIELVPGAREPLKELREEFAIVDPNGNERSRIAKTPVPAGTQGGAFVSTLQFTFPKGIPPGPYQVQSRLYVNGQPAQTSNVKIQVALRADGTIVVARTR